MNPFYILKSFLNSFFHSKKNLQAYVEEGNNIDLVKVYKHITTMYDYQQVMLKTTFVCFFSLDVLLIELKEPASNH